MPPYTRKSPVISCREPGSLPLAEERAPRAPEPDDTCPLCLAPAVRQAPMMRWTEADGWREIIEARCLGTRRVVLFNPRDRQNKTRVMRGCGLVAVEDRRVDGPDLRSTQHSPTPQQPKEEATVTSQRPKPTHQQCIAVAAQVIDKEITLEEAVRKLGLPSGQSLGWAIARVRAQRFLAETQPQEPAQQARGASDATSPDSQEAQALEGPSETILEGQPPVSDSPLPVVTHACISDAVSKMQGLTRRDWRYLPREVRAAIETLEEHVYGEVLA